MIIRETPVDNVWYRSAAIWFVALLVLNCIFWPLIDALQFDLGNYFWMLYIWLGVTVLLWLIGRIFGQVSRVVYFVSIISVFGGVPMLFASLLPGMALVYLDRMPVTVLIILFAAVLYWMMREVRFLADRVRRKRFVEREFEIAEHAIFLNRAPKTNIDPVRIKRGSWQEMLGDWVFPKLFFLAFCAYPLQRFLSDSGGVIAVLFLLSVLCIYFVFYIAGRMACGFYLWIYTIWKLERRHGKPVVFADTDS